MIHSRIADRSGEAAVFRAKRPKHHPMWSYGNGRARPIEGRVVAMLRGPAKHVTQSRSAIRGAGFRARASLNHCIPSSSTHIGGSPILFSFPGVQIQPLLPLRRTVVVPSWSISATVASRVISAGPERIARAIFTAFSRSSSQRGNDICCWGSAIAELL